MRNFGEWLWESMGEDEEWVLGAFLDIHYNKPIRADRIWKEKGAIMVNCSEMVRMRVLGPEIPCKLRLFVRSRDEQENILYVHAPKLRSFRGISPINFSLVMESLPSRELERELSHLWNLDSSQRYATYFVSDLGREFYSAGETDLEKFLRDNRGSVHSKRYDV